MRQDSENEIESLARRAKDGDGGAQTRLGMLYFSRNRPLEALPWLERAVAQGIPEASNLLGLMHLNGIGLPQNPVSAIPYLRHAAEYGLKEASYTLANMFFNGIGIQVNADMAVQYLLDSARQHHLPALRTLGVLHRLTPQSREQSRYCLQLAAQGGDALSQYYLSSYYLSDSNDETKLVEGLFWLRSAVERGVYSAIIEYEKWRQRFGDAQIGEKLQSHNHDMFPIKERQELLPPMLSQSNENFVAEELYRETVYQYPKTLSPILCEHLMNLAMPVLTPSQVVDPDTGQIGKNRVRTSSSMYFRLSMYDFIVGIAVQHLAGIAGESVANAEPVAVLRYKPGEEYKPHYDYFVSAGNREELVDGRGGQRTTTVFVYLNDVEEGGETDFPKLEVRIAPEKGKAVRFKNLDGMGRPNIQTLHAGRPVIRGEKWLATVWFRERPFIWGDLSSRTSS